MHELIRLFLCFWQIGLFSFGGGYAVISMIQQQIVGGLGYMDATEFTDIITISQMTPGPLAVNASTFVGMRLSGIPGALAATVACVISGIVISQGLYRFFQKNKENKSVMQVLQSLQAAAVGLIASAGMTILSYAFFLTDESGKQVNLKGILLFLLSFFLLKKYKINPVFLMLLTGILGILLQGTVQP